MKNVVLDELSILRIITSMESPYPLYHLSPLRRFAASRPDDYGNPEQQGVLLCWCYSNNTRAKNLVSTLRDEYDTPDDRYKCVTHRIQRYFARVNTRYDRHEHHERLGRSNKYFEYLKLRM